MKKPEILKKKFYEFLVEKGILFEYIQNIIEYYPAILGVNRYQTIDLQYVFNNTLPMYWMWRCSWPTDDWNIWDDEWRNIVDNT